MQSFGNKWSGKHKHVVFIGGGLSSTGELPLWVLSKYGAENVDFVICALKGESPDLWRIVEWLENKTGKEVIKVAWTPYKVVHHYNAKPRNYWINAPQWAWSDIWDVFNHAGIIGNSMFDPCSRLLKRETSQAFVIDHYDPACTTLHVGIGYDEIDRMMAIRGNWKKIGFQIEAPLAEDDYLSSKPLAWHSMTTVQKCQELFGFVPEVYAWGGIHNNCGGFCVKAGHKHMKRFMRSKSELFAYHEAQEKAFRERTGLNATVMTDALPSGKRPLTLEEFRLRNTAQVSMFEAEDFSDETGCHFCDSLA